jgi:hypothetical protein
LERLVEFLLSRGGAIVLEVESAHQLSCFFGGLAQFAFHGLNALRGVGDPCLKFSDMVVHLGGVVPLAD